MSRKKKIKDSGSAPENMGPAAAYLEQETDGVFMTETNEEIKQEDVLEHKVEVVEKIVEKVEDITKYQQPLKIEPSNLVRILCNETRSPFIGTQRYSLVKGEVISVPRFVAEILAEHKKCKILGPEIG